MGSRVCEHQCGSWQGLRRGMGRLQWHTCSNSNYPWTRAAVEDLLGPRVAFIITRHRQVWSAPPSCLRQSHVYEIWSLSIHISPASAMVPRWSNICKFAVYRLEIVTFQLNVKDWTAGRYWVCRNSVNGIESINNVVEVIRGAPDECAA